jgi:hypothetical protein
MKQIVLILIFNLTIGFAFCQELGKGIDNNPVLNKAESDYLNVFLKNQRLDFDFIEKKTAFVSVDLGVNLRSKNDYFTYYYKKSETAERSGIKMIVLDSIQRQATNGFDVLILMDIQKKEIDKNFIEKIIYKLSECEKEKPSELYQLGLDDNPILTKLESDYFNEMFKERKANYIFDNLKIGFFYGNNGSRIQTKKQYFDLVKNRLGNCYSASNDIVIELTNEEKAESGGYDLIIVSWSKILPTEKSKKRMIKELNNNN